MIFTGKLRGAWSHIRRILARHTPFLMALGYQASAPMVAIRWKITVNSCGMVPSLLEHLVCPSLVRSSSATEKCPSDSRSYTVDFDTGSSDLFVPSPSCGDTCSGHTPYNSSGSSSSVDLNQTFTLTYGGNSSVDGKEYTDVVEIVGLTVCSVVSSSAEHSPCLIIGAQPNSRCCNSVFCGLWKQQLPSWWPDGHGFPVYIGL